jgi:hypothetical protein
MGTLVTWFRELAGWLLLGGGVGAFVLCYVQFLLNGLVVQGVIFGFAGLVMFRGGLALLKLAVASRAARDVKREMATQAAAVKQVRPQLGSGQPAGRPRKSTVPGPGRN